MPYLEIYSASRIRDWLTGKCSSLSDLGPSADQDVFHMFACERRPEQLIRLLRTPGITRLRAFDMACAICERTISLLEHAESLDEILGEEDRHDQIATLLSFVRDNRCEFDEYHELDSLGGDYEDKIQPMIARIA
ncbi:MAG: hypothetical protein AAFU85_18390 [Planctomycetota bacterium]